MEVPIAYRANYDALEGPTRKQAAKMADRRKCLLGLAAKALAAGNDDRAFDYDCAAMDIETDLNKYGFGRLIND